MVQIVVNNQMMKRTDNEQLFNKSINYLACKFSFNSDWDNLKKYVSYNGFEVEIDDNNIALIANGYPSDVTREKDGLMKFFFEFIDNNLQAKQMFKSLDIPVITKDMIETCLEKIPISVDKNFIINFILNGQKIIKNHID